MPGVRRFNRRHGNIFRKKSQLSKNTTAIKKLKANSHQEMNFLDTVVAAGSIANTGTVFNICLLAEGDGQSERTGRQIRIKNIELKGRWAGNAAATLTNMRLILLKTNNDQATVPLVLDVLQFADVNSPYDRSIQQRSFKILYDRRVSCEDTVNNRNILLTVNRKVNSRMDYSGAAATEAHAGRGCYYILAISDLAANSPTIDFRTRVSFTDK